MAYIPVGTAVGYLTLDYTRFSRNLTTAVNQANSLANKFSDTLGSGLQTIGGKISAAGTTLTRGITVPLATAVGGAVKFGSEFDKQMSNVSAVSNATEAEFNAMRDAAIDWGEKTVYTATEAGEALYYMGLAGWEAEDSIAALGPVLNLAAAGDLDLGRTSDIVTDAMTAMKVEAGELTNGIENTTHFTNVLAAAMANSNTDVDQMGEAFKYVSPLAGALNFDMRDLALGIGLMANVGVKGSQAGTGLRQALKNLISPTDKAKIAMDKYGVSLFDDTGKAKTMKQLMDELRGTFGDLNIDVYDAAGELKSAEQIMEEYGHSLPTSQQEKFNAIVEIFGTRALPGVLGIIEQSDDKYERLTSAINGADAAFVRHGDDLMTYSEAVEKYGEELVNTSKDFEILGAAEGMAQTQMDNLKGDWIKFTSALGTMAIEITDLVKGPLREFVQRLTELVRAFNDMDDEQQKHILKLVAFAAALGPILLVIGKIISGIGGMITTFAQVSNALTKIKAGFDMLSATAAAAGTSIGAIVGTVLIVVVVIATLIAAFKHLWDTSEEFRNNMTKIWEDLKSRVSEACQKIVDALNELGFNFEDIVDVLKAVWDGFCQLLAPAFEAAFKIITEVIGFVVNRFADMIEIISGIVKGLKTGDWSLFWKGMSDIAEDTINFVINILDTLAEFVWNTIQVIANWFGADWTMTWDEAKQALVDWAESVVQWFTDVHTAVQDFFYNVAEWIVNLPENIAEGIASVVETIAEWASDMIEKGKEVGENFVTSVVEWFDQLPYKVGYAVGFVLATVVQWVADMISKAVEFGTNFIQAIIEWFEQLPGKIKEFIDSAYQTITQFVTDGIQSAIEFGTQFIQNVVEWFQQLPTKISEFVTTTIESIKKFKDDAIAFAKEAGQKFIQNVVEFFTTLPGKIKEFLNQSIEHLKQWVIDMGIKGKEAIEELIKNVVEIAKSIPEKVREIGENIVKGVWEGIENAKSWFKDKITSFFSGLVDGAKDALGISSPSKVFADEVGKWIPLGIVEGVEEEMPDAVNDIQSTIEDGMEEVSPDVQLNTSFDNFINTFKSGFNQLLTWFQTIETKFIGSIDNMTDAIHRLISAANSLNTINLSDIFNTQGIGTESVGNLFGNQDMMQMFEMFMTTMTDKVQAIADSIQAGEDSEEVAQFAGGGDWIFPLYFGGDLIDTYILNAQQRQDLMSGGR